MQARSLAPTTALCFGLFSPPPQLGVRMGQGGATVSGGGEALAEPLVPEGRTGDPPPRAPPLGVEGCSQPRRS